MTCLGETRGELGRAIRSDLSSNGTAELHRTAVGGPLKQTGAESKEYPLTALKCEDVRKSVAPSDARSDRRVGVNLGLNGTGSSHQRTASTCRIAFAIGSVGCCKQEVGLVAGSW